ncbi:hypothetical protein HAX54_041903, partial [Datura stramonium]|nr:hypothetical protein [Datura stramonium]
ATNLIPRYISGSQIELATRCFVIVGRPVAPVYCFSPVGQWRSVNTILRLAGAPSVLLIL